MQILPNAPHSIGPKKVINETSNLQYRGMFIKTPENSFVYPMLADSGFYLTKATPNSLRFTSCEKIKNDAGESYPQIVLNNPNINDVSLNLEVYRAICSNGMKGFSTMEQTNFVNILTNKISRTQFYQAICGIKRSFEHQIGRYVDAPMNLNAQNRLVKTFINALNAKSTISAFSKYHSLNRSQTLNLFKGLEQQNLLESNRNEDNHDSFWMKYNTVQENMTKYFDEKVGTGAHKIENVALTHSLEKTFDLVS